MEPVDLLVIGGGLIGLASAAVAADRGLRVRLVDRPQPGSASPRSAGMLAPSVERSEGPARDFALASRDLFPDFLAWLEESTGRRVHLNRLGVLQVALSPRGVTGLRGAMGARARWLDRGELTDLEPSLDHAEGAVLNPEDGAVDNVALGDALRAVLASHANVHLSEDRIVGVMPGPRDILARGESGATYTAGQALVAAGAWSSTVAGASHARAVEPVRGQLVAYRSAPLAHVVYGPTGYIVPRGNGETFAGSTMERVGFDVRTTPEGIAKVSEAARAICPRLVETPVYDSWAGLRPVTADGLPLLGRDPAHPRLLYACGHGRNGVLLTPLTAYCVAELALGKSPTYDLSQFRPERFSDKFGSL